MAAIQAQSSIMRNQVNDVPWAIRMESVWLRRGSHLASITSTDLTDSIDSGSITSTRGLGLGADISEGGCCFPFRDLAEAVADTDADRS